MHLSADPGGTGDPTTSPLFVGIWKVRVRRGAGGAVAGQISQINGPNEDANHNGRLDPGEDTNVNGLLDAGGQPYGLVVAGPVFGSGTQTWGGTTHTLPASEARLDRSLYGCADNVKATIFKSGTTALAVSQAVTWEVIKNNGQVVDTEKGFAFSAGPANTYVSVPVPLRSGQPSAVSFNGILETSGLTADEPYTVRARFADTPREAAAAARVSCSPQLLPWRFSLANQDGTQQAAIFGGCDNDQFMDSGENVTYSVAFVNGNRDQDFSDVQAFLSVSGPGANAVKILNSPQDMGRIPGGATTAASFAVRVDPTALAAITVANRQVDMTLTLQANNGNIQLPRQTFTFHHALNSDNETFHYSTDYPAGGREIRDLNRNLQIDKPDVLDPFLGIQLADEDITFNTMFIPGTAAGLVTNTLGQDLNGDGSLDNNERDLIPNGVLDLGILAAASGPTPGQDKVPFNFDLNNGGWNGFRLPYSRPGPTTLANAWEWVHGGVCGTQSSAGPGHLGIWHTGDGNAATPSPTAAACDNHLIASDITTPPGNEFLEDFLESPIIAKVHQTADARGLPYSAEFQRFAVNMNFQTQDENAGANINLENNVDDDSGNCILCQDFSFSYGGVNYQIADFHNAGAGSYPGTPGILQRTFGPLVDPDGSITSGGKTVTGDETGFTGFTQNSNSHSTSPIPTAPPDLIPYPVPTAPTVLASDGTPWTSI